VIQQLFPLTSSALQNISAGVQVSTLRSQRSGSTRVEWHDRSRLLSQSRKLHSSFLTHPAHAIIASENTVFSLAQNGYAFEELVTIIECNYPCEMIVTKSPRDQQYAMTMVIEGEAESSGQCHHLSLLTQLADPPQAGGTWNMRVTAAFHSDHAREGWTGSCTHYPVCVCLKPHAERLPQASDALSLAFKLLPFDNRANERRALSYANRLALSVAGGYHDAVSPSAASCEWDISPQKGTPADNPVVFSCIAGRDPVEVFDVPVLRCSRCGEQTFDLAQLSRIEGLLRTWSQREYCASYRFRQLQPYL
jgi:hypothetical protein